MVVQDTRRLTPAAQEAIRRQVVQAIQDGMSKSAAARTYHVSRTSIDAWLAAFASGGAEGLVSGKRGRKPGSRLSVRQVQWVKRRLIDKCPDQLKLPFALWTREAVVELIRQRFGIRLSVWTIGRYLRRWGFSPQRPVRRAYERDPEKILHWLDTEYPAIQRRAKAENAEIYWGDEMGLRSDDQVGRTWSIKGQTPEIPSSGRRFGCSMISAITNRGTLAFMVFSERFTAGVFLRFLARMLRQPRSRSRKAYLIVDGHPVHRSRRVQRWVEARREAIELFYLPGYAPELNPDELLNHDTKAAAGRRKRPRNQSEMMASVRSHLRGRQKQPTLVQRFFEEPHVRYAAAD